METFLINVGQDNHRIQFSTTITPNGISILLTGGTSSHVGGMVLSVPRLSLTGQGRSADTWIIPVAGHKDVIVGEQAAIFISQKTGQTVAVTAGIHIENATSEDLEILKKNCFEGAKLVVEKYLNKQKG